jgi:hypothetical protein
MHDFHVPGDRVAVARDSPDGAPRLATLPRRSQEMEEELATLGDAEWRACTSRPLAGGPYARATRLGKIVVP